MVTDTAKGGLQGTPDHYKEAARQLPPLASAFNAEKNIEDPANPLTAVLGSYGARTRADLNRIAHDLQAGGHGSSIQKRSDATDNAQSAGNRNADEERREKERAFYRQIAMLQQQLATQLYEINKKIEETDEEIRKIKTDLEQLVLRRSELIDSINKINDDLNEKKLLTLDEESKKLKEEQREKLLRERDKIEEYIRAKEKKHDDLDKDRKDLIKVREDIDRDIKIIVKEASIGKDSVVLEQISERATETQNIIKTGGLSQLSKKYSAAAIGNADGLKSPLASGAKNMSVATEPSVASYTLNEVYSGSVASKLDPQKSGLNVNDAFKVAHGKMEAPTVENSSLAAPTQASVHVTKFSG